MEEKRNWLWFKWDIDSFDGPTSKIFLNGFIGKRGEARAAFLELITIIYKLAENGKEPWIDCSDFYYQMIAGEIDSEPPFIRQVIDRLVSIGTFETRPNPTKEGEIQVTSTRVLAEVESRAKTSEARRQAGKVGGMLKHKKSVSNEINHIEANAKQMLANAKQVLAIGKQNLADKDKDKDKDKVNMLVVGGMGGEGPHEVNPPDGGTAAQPPEKTNPQIFSNGSIPEPEPETKKPKRVPRPKFDPTGKQKYGDWVYLSEKQKSEVVEYYKRKELDVEDLREAVNYLDAWFANNQNQRHHYVDDAKILKGWPLDRVLERKAKLLRVEREESYKYKTFTK